MRMNFFLIFYLIRIPFGLVLFDFSCLGFDIMRMSFFIFYLEGNRFGLVLFDFSCFLNLKSKSKLNWIGFFFHI
jgi:hypothetical protein